MFINFMKKPLVKFLCCFVILTFSMTSLPRKATASEIAPTFNNKDGIVQAMLGYLTTPQEHITVRNAYRTAIDYYFLREGVTDIVLNENNDRGVLTFTAKKGADPRGDLQQQQQILESKLRDLFGAEAQIALTIVPQDDDDMEFFILIIILFFVFLIFLTKYFRDALNPPTDRNRRK